MSLIGKIVRLPLREIWNHEAYDFTTWLANNIDVLNDVIELNLVSAEREQSAGAFNVDIVAEDDKGQTVIVENQFGKSDHDHLGKLITYVTMLNARAAIWIVEEPRPEHVAAVSSLNETQIASFYLLKLEAVRIGQSEPAALLTPIIAPSEETRQVGQTKKEKADRYIIRNQFWTELLNLAKERTSLHSSISPGDYSWLGTSAGVRGISYNYTVRQHDAVVEIYIDRGKNSGTENERIFDQLLEHKDEIESQFGEPLVWQRLDDRRACRIMKVIPLGGYRDDKETWKSIQDSMIETMIRLDSAAGRHIKRIRI